MAHYYWLFLEVDCLRWLQPEFFIAVPVVKFTLLFMRFICGFLEITCVHFYCCVGVGDSLSKTQVLEVSVIGGHTRTRRAAWLSPPGLRIVFEACISYVSITDFKATFHLTTSMHGERATGKIQKNNYHHWSCGPSVTCKTSSVSLIFAHGTHRNVKNR